MHGHNLVAVYQSRADAERVRQSLIADGFPGTDIRLSGVPGTQTQVAETREEPGFWDWLFGDVPDNDRDVYGTHIRENRAVLSVRAPTEEFYRRALDIMEKSDPVELDDRAEEGVASAALRPGVATAATTGQAGMRTAAAGTARGEQQEQVIPVVKEELSVGKRVTERRTRVKTYVIERPVEEQVMLRDERVIIEHRPVSGTAARDAATMPQQREFDVVERHEEPVVEKRGRVTEEVVVRREATERPETVRGTVQETKVEVEKEPAGVGARPGRPADPTPRR